MRYLILLFFVYSNASLALGLGDAKLKSYLGEVFSASIHLTDVEKSTDIACFTVTENSEIPVFRKISATINAKGTEHWLSVNTTNIINDPIINLKVTHHCTPQINREYVLLLDPAPLKKTTVESDVASIVTIGNTAPSSAKFATQEAIAPKPAIKAKRPKKSSRSDTIDQKLMDAYVGKQAPTTNLPLENAAGSPATPAIMPKETSRPYLKISSGNFVDTQLPHLTLRLETEVDLNRAAPTASPLNEEVLDEVTVMANRLAHLEKQLIGLQSRNAQLMHENAENKRLLDEQKFSWLNYLLILIGITAALVCAEWIRRVIVNRKLNRQENSWFEAEEELHALNETPALSADEKHHPDNTPFSDPYFDDVLYRGFHDPNHMTSGVSLSDTVEDSHESILENAEVFIEHGRPALAIQLLQNHLVDFPSESPKIWLKLLALLVAEDDEEGYEKTAIECNQYFNIKLPKFTEFANKDSSSIEDFPHLVSRLEGVWGSQYAVEFLDDLVYNQASQPREGFSQATFDELFLLKKVAQLIASKQTPEQYDFYQPASANPTLDNIAFNEAAFSSQAHEKESNLAEQASINDAEQAEAIRKKVALNTDIAAFQAVPAYDVDLLLDFDHDEKKEADIDIDTNESLPSITSLENAADNDNHAEEIDFSSPVTGDKALPTEPLKKPQVAKEKSSNLIEWDLPKLDG
ncbi:MAG: hypothetical protein CVU29_05765 [Betaproteobacteria bacterium HGW-Betaproteobacteria-22]|nr:MAG: hypothetical protein CVU29_05765 [Betaproteobacteria bacterium HGW-Betaproteobacteria-22]